MGLFQAVGFHQVLVAHDVLRIAVSDNMPIVDEEDAIAHLQNKLQVMG